MFSEHRPRQERLRIGRNSQANNGKRLGFKLCFGLTIIFVGFWIVMNPTLSIEYDTSSMLDFWTDNSTVTYEESQKRNDKIGLANESISEGILSGGDVKNALPSNHGINLAITSINKENDTQANIIERLRPTGRIVYSYVRGDRSGAAIQDMLMAHAFAFSRGQRYGGACQLRKFPDHVINPRKDLLQILGLESEMPFNCSLTGKLMNRAKYTKQDTGIFTRKYLEYMHVVMAQSTNTTTNTQNLAQSSSSSSDRPKQITVHIRRGDITPCRPRTNGYPRYLPNQHYMTLIERYKSKLMMMAQEDDHRPIQVVVFSESETYEQLEEFSKKGYDLQLDGSIEQVWKAIAFDSDVVILSRSSFSLVPAVLATKHATIVYTPFWHKPLTHWDNLGSLDPALLNTTLVEFRRLKQSCPTNKKERRRQEKQRKRKIKYS